MCENTNNPEMSSLPRTKYKEKRLQQQSQTEILLQNMPAVFYRRPCFKQQIP